MELISHNVQLRVLRRDSLIALADPLCHRAAGVSLDQHDVAALRSHIFKSRFKLEPPNLHIVPVHIQVDLRALDRVVKGNDRDALAAYLFHKVYHIAAYHIQNQHVNPLGDQIFNLIGLFGCVVVRILEDNVGAQLLRLLLHNLFIEFKTVLRLGCKGNSNFNPAVLRLVCLCIAQGRGTGRSSGIRWGGRLAPGQQGCREDKCKQSTQKLFHSYLLNF